MSSLSIVRRAAVLALTLAVPVLAQAPPALEQLVGAERAFAAHASVVGWKQAFLDYFAEDAVGFDGSTAEPARAQVQAVPDPAPGVQILWEPRYGDIAASGELGWLTGPSTSINPARDRGQPRHGNYASVWKRQADGGFKVVLDVGVNQAAPVAFAPGFTAAPRTGRFTAESRDTTSDATSDATATLAEADRALTTAAATDQAAAYRGRLEAGARLHRHDVVPRVGESEILAWLATQPPAPAGEPRVAEAARSGDLGYTWGRLGMGIYVRVWTRTANGTWTVALDVVQ